MPFKLWEEHSLPRLALKQVLIWPILVYTISIVIPIFSLFPDWNSTWKCHSHWEGHLPNRSIHRFISLVVWPMLQWISFGELNIFQTIECRVLLSEWTGCWMLWAKRYQYLTSSIYNWRGHHKLRSPRVRLLLHRRSVLRSELFIWPHPRMLIWNNCISFQNLEISSS